MVKAVTPPALAGTDGQDSGGGDAVVPPAPGKRRAKARRMNLVLVREVSDETCRAYGIPESIELGPLLEVLADETADIIDEKGVAAWMEKQGFEGELYVLAFRRGDDKRKGTNDRLRRRRYKPEPAFQVE